jgi:hypothetical protein
MSVALHAQMAAFAVATLGLLVWTAGAETIGYGFGTAAGLIQAAFTIRYRTDKLHSDVAISLTGILGLCIVTTAFIRDFREPLNHWIGFAGIVVIVLSAVMFITFIYTPPRGHTRLTQELTDETDFDMIYDASSDCDQVINEACIRDDPFTVEISTTDA